MSRKEPGCAVCHGAHNVQSCEDVRAAAYWREKGEAMLRRAEKLERRASGQPMPVGDAQPRLPR